MNCIDQLLKKNNIAIITCYDASFATVMTNTEVDALLVGDSLGLMIKGEKNTRQVTIDEMIYHTKSVRQGASSIPIIADMPINSYKNKQMALKNALRLSQAGANFVKIEGGNDDVCEIIKYLTQNYILVCGHIGYTPQKMSENKQIYNPDSILNQSKKLERAGIKMIVLSMMTEAIDQIITKNLNIPTIAFRSSTKCKGQVEILYDLIGISTNPENLLDGDIEKNYTKLNFSSILNFIQKVHNKI